VGKQSARTLPSIDRALAVLELELSEARQRQLLSVTTRTATGNGNIDHTFQLDQRFRLVFIRGHFAGAAGTAPLVILADSAAGSAYDARLFTITQAGTGKDVHLRIGGGDTGDPAAWTFQAGDAIRIQWTNPNGGNITWGVEVGLALAS
jgi:hypothetical protein